MLVVSFGSKLDLLQPDGVNDLISSHEVEKRVGTDEDWDAGSATGNGKRAASEDGGKDLTLL